MTTPLTSITAPGLYEGVPEEAYHAGVIGDGIQTWSRSDIKDWLAAPTPAHFRSRRDTPPAPTVKKDFDFGSVVHKLILGAGQPIAMIRADSWRSAQVRAKAADERARGRIPLLADDYMVATAMRTAVLRNSEAAALLDEGRPEVSGYWFDLNLDLWLRIRIDWLTPTELVDYKTADTAMTWDFARDSYNYGYYLQHPMYLDVAGALGHPAQRFRFIVQEKEPPYETVVYELDEDSVALGRQQVLESLTDLAECLHTDDWPGYPAGTVPLRLPRWAFPSGFTTASSSQWAAVDAEDLDPTSSDTAAIDYLESLTQLESS